jgi:CHAT domain-containing protein
MSHFYRAIRDGKTKIEALQAAQLYIKRVTVKELIAHNSQRLDALPMEAIERLDRTFTQKHRFERLRDRYGESFRPFAHLYHWAPFILLGDWY